MRSLGNLLTASLLVTVALLLAGCESRPLPTEKAARRQAAELGRTYRPEGRKPAMPTLQADAPLADFLRYALLNHPQIEAAYLDWIASVERITVERALPDPRITLQTDIGRMVESLMPGLMAEFPGRGKLAAQAAVASAESQVKYFAFETAVLQTALAFKKTYYQLYFLTEKIRVDRETLALLGDLERNARAQNEVGKVTLQDVLRAQIEQDRMATEIANLEDSRQPLLAQFKAALGLRAAEPEPPLPGRFETTTLSLTPEQLLASAYARNPRLQAMAAEVQMAEASIRLAARGKTPDFSAGLEVDVKAAPWMWRPSIGVTLPIWREKIAAQIAAAQAGKRAAQARLSAEQIALAVELAEKSFMLREAGRNLALVREALLPKARQSLEVARAAYLAGKTEFFDVLDAQRALLDFSLTEIEALTQRELALAELALAIVGVPPEQAPILPETSKSTFPAEAAPKSHAN